MNSEYVERILQTLINQTEPFEIKRMVKKENQAMFMESVKMLIDKGEDLRHGKSFKIVEDRIVVQSAWDYHVKIRNGISCINIDRINQSINDINSNKPNQ